MTKKNIMFLSVSLILIILLGIGVSYSMWNISVSQDTNNTAYTECFDLSITNKENNINLDNAYPISNDKGKSLTPYTFTVTNTCDITAQYNINLEVLNNSTLPSKFIDVMFEGNINLLSSYDTTDKVNTSSIESRKLTTGILKSQESKDYSLRLWIDYNTTLEDLNNEIKTFKSKIVVVGKPINYTGDTVFDFDYTGGEQTFIAPVSGTYRLETWGAGAGRTEISYSFGSYTSGLINFEKNTNLYVYVGENGYKKTYNHTSATYRFNGGGYGNFACYKYYLDTENNPNYGMDYAGGGATDIRLENGIWNNFESLKSRIMVAAGSGGTPSNSMYRVSNGGGLYSEDGGYYRDEKYKATGATQTSSGFVNGKFGLGGYAVYGGNGCNINEGGGGGGGYYGGGGAKTGNQEYQAATGAGGSSFISGHNGCDAIKEESTENSIIHTGQSIHYSGLYFTNTLMIDGEGYRWTDKKEEQIGMPSHSDNSIIMGNSGNGYARITLVSIEE